MGQKIGKEVSIAAADAVGMAGTDVVAAYPITPQTHIVEHLAELVADGSLDAEYIPVESEHSAMSVCCGSSAMGARTFTCTSSQGLALMNEIVFIASSLRLPIVMIVCNRHLSAPIGIGNDHSDIMPLRDCGWIQVFTENGQEVFDHVLFAFRVAESSGVSLPMIINVDGFVLSHMIEPIEYWDTEMVKSYLPDFEPLFRLNPDDPITIGALSLADNFSEAKKAQNEALIGSKAEIIKAWDEMEELTGRRYKPVETYRVDDAEVVFITMGSISGVVKAAVNQLREDGMAAGLIRLRLWRPFPFQEFRQAVSHLKQLIVIDRALSYGGPPGPVVSELRSALYHLPVRPVISSYTCGLGGRDMTFKDFVAIFQQSIQSAGDLLETNDCHIYGVRE